MQRLRVVLARSPPGMNEAGSLQMPSCTNFSEEKSSRNHWHLEASWAPIDELDCPLGFDLGNGSIDILGNDITPIKQGTGHCTWCQRDGRGGITMLTVFSFFGIAFNLLGSCQEMQVWISKITHHLITILEARECHFSDRVLFMTGFSRRQQRGIGSQREMYARKPNTKS